MRRSTLYFYAFLLVFFISLKGFGQIFYSLKSGNILGYMGYLPPGYDESNEKFPCIIFLHGSGEKGGGSSESELSKVAIHGPLKHVKNGHTMCFSVNGKTECFIVIAPQDYSWKDKTQKILDLHAEIISKYKIDPNRVYLTGLSMGGQGTYYTAGDLINQPNRFAAVAPISASTYQCDNAQRIGEWNIPLWHFHGDADNTEHSYEKGLASYDCVLQGNPTAETKFTTYEGVGHSAWNQAYTTSNKYENPNLYEWFLSKTLATYTLNINLGTDKSITLPTNSITINSTISSTNTITKYSWTKQSGPAATLVNASTSKLTVNNMVEGTYVFRLTITDSKGNIAYDEVNVTALLEVVNQAPTANAGEDQIIALPTNLTEFNGSGNDTDGNITSYVWTKVNGPDANLTNANTANLTVQNLVEGTYVFGLTVTDNEGAIGKDNVSLSVVNYDTNQPPTVNAGSDKSIQLPENTAVLHGAAYDPDGSITKYHWIKQNGPTVTMQNKYTADLLLSNLEEGTYVFRLWAKDDDGEAVYDDVTLTVKKANGSISVNAGSDKTIVLPTNSVVLEGYASDSDGTISSYQWSLQSGPSAILINTSTESLTASNLLEGIYVFRLTVTNNRMQSAFDEATVYVRHNQPPSVNAGPDKTIQLPMNATVLSGSADDPDGTILKYHWIQQSGPSATMQNKYTSNLELSNLLEGTYVFKLWVKDDVGEAVCDAIILTVVGINMAEARKSTSSDQLIDNRSFLTPSKIYPNPVRKNLTIEISPEVLNNYPSLNFKIVDLMGHTVINKNISRQDIIQLNLSGLKNATYVYLISSENHIIERNKLIKN